jgi:hypothetical protein
VEVTKKGVIFMVQNYKLIDKLTDGVDTTLVFERYFGNRKESRVMVSSTMGERFVIGQVYKLTLAEVDPIEVVSQGGST